MKLAEVLARVFGAAACEPATAEGEPAPEPAPEPEPEAGERTYLRGAIWPALKHDIGMPAFMPVEKYSEELSGIWIGSKG